MENRAIFCKILSFVFLTFSVLSLNAAQNDSVSQDNSVLLAALKNAEKMRGEQEETANKRDREEYTEESNQLDYDADTEESDEEDFEEENDRFEEPGEGSNQDFLLAKKLQEENDLMMALMLQQEELNGQEEMGYAFEEDSDEEEEEGEVLDAFHEPYQKPSQKQSQGLIEQFIKHNDIYVKEDLETIGKVYELEKDRRCAIQRVSEDVVVVQLPSSGEVFEDIELLSDMQSSNDLKKFLSSSMEKKNPPSLKLRGTRKKKKKKKKISVATMEEVNKGKVSFGKLGVCKSVITCSFSIEEFLRDQAISQASSRFTKAQAKKVLPTPEVFIVKNFNGGWSVIRVERMSNGMIGILLVDQKLDIEDHSEWLAELTKLFL